MLFETNSESKAEGTSPSHSQQQQQQQQQRGNSNRRRAWLWKNPLHNSFDDTDIAIADRHVQPATGGLVAPPPSAESSRRESLCSSGQGSPAAGRSPRRAGRETRKPRKDSSPREPSSSPAQRLYRVLEEQALGEAVSRLTSSRSSKQSQQQQQQQNLSASGDASPNNRYSY